MVYRLLPFIVVFGLAGCATNEGQPHQPKASATCCKSLNDASYVTLVPGETREFRITPETQTFGFPEGRSYFVGVTVPRSDGLQTLTLRTLPVNTLRPSETHVFVPRIAIVAPDGKVSRYVEPDFRPHTAGLLWRNAGWLASLQLAAGETRVAVYTATLLTQTLRLPLENEPTSFWYVPSGPTGSIEVTLDGG
jgi:hypothetical protein